MGRVPDRRKASRKSDSEVSPNKRLKTLTLPSSPVSKRKGKEKLEEIREEEEDIEGGGGGGGGDLVSETCGICLSEEGKAIRGRIDSCNHYFCFVCIMEWAKVETRCPMCKQRFRSIHRPPKSGLFLRDRIVDVPVRDQVYDLDGNATIGPFDPYAEVICSECHSSENENLLLLCDLCDSAAHTYCVGLGHTVPEGDWYCHDCTVSRNEHLNCKIDSDCHNQDLRKNFDFTIYEIVREGKALDELSVQRYSNNQMHESQIENGRLTRRSSTVLEQSSIPVVPVGEAELSSSGEKIVEQGARTLRRCRNLHVRIQTLRENWNALRSGSVNFSSTICSSGGKSKNISRNSGAANSNRQSQSHSFAAICMFVYKHFVKIGMPCEVDQ
ncbi:uncharacterized protein LOC143879257 [Tasmannia lanceolata]|uniref:uncharacterized protein LOC143879257 n=1 Tax=Tasmannia lanceolata TaxID=3420 RepID=UPI004064160E